MVDCDLLQKDPDVMEIVSGSIQRQGLGLDTKTAVSEFWLFSGCATPGALLKILSLSFPMCKARIASAAPGPPTEGQSEAYCVLRTAST
jgi:hypothetical protein